MEDGVKENSTQCKENPKFLGKAGWVKKGQGRLLASYKERFIHVEKTEILVYENEDLQNCLERLDLENYDKCHELKSPFKKKHRLILIRSPKSANKVHDLKLQAQTAEEKEAWIKALSDGINRAKNKIFDEVKVDESCNLEHVTRTRPKGNRNRRPPTRIHMKEVADMSSEGILRLDLDLESALMPNGTHHVSDREANRTPTPATDLSDGAEKSSERAPDEDTKTETESSPQKKVIKPPMPPIKEAKPSLSPEEEAGKEEESEKKVFKPPMPPSKDLKASVAANEEAPEEAKAEETPEKSPEVRKKTGPPPTPPNKPSSSSSISNPNEASQTRHNSHPPTPPSKDKKPSSASAGLDQEVEGLTGEEGEEEEGGDSTVEETGAAEETREAEQTLSKDTDASDASDSPESVSKESDNDHQAPSEAPQKSPSPPLVPKKKPEKAVQPSTGACEDQAVIPQLEDREDSSAPESTALESTASSLPADEALAKSDVPTVVVSVNDPLNDSLGLGPLFGHLTGEQKKKKAEEKSVDSGQHSDDDSEGSGSEDTLAASTAALRGSNAGLDVLDASEDDAQISVSLRHPRVPAKPQILPKSFPYRHSEPTPPKPLTKARSASSGDLLSDSSVCSQLEQQIRAEATSSSTPSDDVKKLEAEVALEMEKTRELLSRVSQSEPRGEEEAVPGDLLSKAMEKLQRADHVLREVRKLAPAKSSSHRKSW